MVHNMPKLLDRFLAYVWAVIKHMKVLVFGFIGSGALASIPWIIPLLPEKYVELLSLLAIAVSEPLVYYYLAIAFLILCIFLASFLAWNEIREALEQKNNELDATRPKLTGHISAYKLGNWGNGLAAIVDIELVNSGAPTGVREWQAFVRLRNGRSAGFSTAMFVDDVPEIEGKRNLVRDDWYLKQGERRLGKVAFHLSENNQDIFQLSVQFKDHLGVMYFAALPDESMMTKMKGNLPWERTR